MVQIGSNNSLADVIKTTIRRFPVAMVFLLGIMSLGVFFIINHADLRHVVTVETFLLVYLALGEFWLSVVYPIIIEDARHKIVWKVLFGLSLVLFAVHAYYLYYINLRDTILSPIEINTTFLSVVSIFVLLNILSVILPFLKAENDIESTNFTFSHIVSTILLLLGSGIVCFCLYLLIAMIGFEAFNYSDSKELALCISITFVILSSFFIFLCRMPSGQNKHISDFKPHVLYDLALRYLLIPLALCFVVTVYIVEIRSIMTSSLSYSLTTYMVSCLMICVTIVYMLVYPIVSGGTTSKYYRLTMRILPVITLPMVVVLADCIFCQIANYGITVLRLYNATLCLLYFVICIGTIVSQRYVRFIPLTFCALLLLSTAHPWGYLNVVRQWNRHLVHKALEEYPHAYLPMDASDAYCWLISMPDDEACNIMDRLLCGYNMNGYEWVSIFMSDYYTDSKCYLNRKDQFELYCERYDPYNIVAGVEFTVDNFPKHDKRTKLRLSYDDCGYEQDDIPDGYSQSRHFSESTCYPVDRAFSDDKVIFEKDGYRFELPGQDEEFYFDDYTGIFRCTDTNGSLCCLALEKSTVYVNQGWALIEVEGVLYEPKEQLPADSLCQYIEQSVDEIE